MSVNDQFQKIVDEVSEKLDRVDCTVGEYQNGIKYVIDELEIVLQASLGMDGDQREGD